MKKDKLSKNTAKIDNKIKELSNTTAKKCTKNKSGGDYQFHDNATISKPMEKKKQKWILINKKGQLSGILDHSAFNTRTSAKEWFQRTSSLSGSTVNIDNLYYVLKVEEYEFLKELDVLDQITDEYIN